MAAEARADKDEVGMIRAALIEVFARLLTGLARLVAGIELHTPLQPEPIAIPSRSITASEAAPVAPALVARVPGCYGGARRPKNGPVAVPAGIGRRSRGVPLFPWPAPAWIRVLLIAWRQLPAPTAGPLLRIDEIRDRSCMPKLLRYRNETGLMRWSGGLNLSAWHAMAAG